MDCFAFARRTDMSKRTPERQCIITRQHGGPDDLLRFALSPDNAVVFDAYQKVPGRGAWLSPKNDILEQAIQKNAFSKAFKTKAEIPNGLAGQVENRLRQMALDMLHLCQKSGLVVAGYEKIKASLLADEVAVLVIAADATENAFEKVKGHLQRLPHVQCFTREELGAISGRDQTVHMALKAGGASEKFLQKAQAFTGFHEKTTI